METKSALYILKADGKEIKSLLPKSDAEGNIHIPLELFFCRIDTNFSNKTLWQKVYIKSLLTHEPRFGFIKTRSGLRQVWPISKSQMLAFPLSKAGGVNDYIYRIMGVKDFFD